MHARPCGITSERGKDCPEPSVSGSPLNLCAKHLRQAAELHASLRDQAPAARLRERCPNCGAMSLMALAATVSVKCALCDYTRKVTVQAIPTRDTRITTGDPIVYYIRFGDRIKIGTTRDLTGRLASLPHDKVLGVERGDRDTERERHAQFAHLRITKRGEWFNIGPDLLAHIDTLSETIGQPAC